MARLTRRYFHSNDPDAPEEKQPKCRCGSEQWVFRFTCINEADTGAGPQECGQAYTVPALTVAERWEYGEPAHCLKCETPVYGRRCQKCGCTELKSPIACPKCGADDNDHEDVVCAKCGQEPPEYCRDCDNFGCCCPDFDSIREEREEVRRYARE